MSSSLFLHPECPRSGSRPETLALYQLSYTTGEGGSRTRTCDLYLSMEVSDFFASGTLGAITYRDLKATVRDGFN